LPHPKIVVNRKPVKQSHCPLTQDILGRIFHWKPDTFPQRSSLLRFLDQKPHLPKSPNHRSPNQSKILR
jgi:hypothetical protein